MNILKSEIEALVNVFKNKASVDYVGSDIQTIKYFLENISKSLCIVSNRSFSVKRLIILAKDKKYLSVCLLMSVLA